MDGVVHQLVHLFVHHIILFYKSVQVELCCDALSEDAYPSLVTEELLIKQTDILQQSSHALHLFLFSNF